MDNYATRKRREVRDWLVAEGYTVVGVDLTPTAIAAATKAAAERGLTNGHRQVI